MRDAAGRLIAKRTARCHYHYTYDLLDRLIEAKKLAVIPGPLSGKPSQPLSESELPAQATQAPGAEFTLKLLHTTCFAYDSLGNLVEEVAVDETTGQSHALRHSHDALGNRTQTILPALPGQAQQQRALNYLHYGSGHLHQINLSQRDTSRCWGTNTAVSRWTPVSASKPTTALRWSGCCAIARVHRFPWSAYAKREANWCTAVPNSAASPPVTSVVPRQMSCTSHRWS